MSELETMVRAFATQLTEQLTSTIDAQALARARQAVFASLGMDAPVAKRRGRPPKEGVKLATKAPKKRRVAKKASKAAPATKKRTKKKSQPKETSAVPAVATAN